MKLLAVKTFSIMFEEIFLYTHPMINLKLCFKTAELTETTEHIRIQIRCDYRCNNILYVEVIL